MNNFNINEWKSPAFLAFSGSLYFFKLFILHWGKPNCGAEEDSWESLGRKIKSVNSKGNQYSLEGLMLKLKLQYLGHLMGRTNSLEKTLMLGKIAGRRKGGWQRMRRLDGINDWMDMSLSKRLGVGDRQGGLPCCHAWGCKESDMIEQLNWAELGHVMLCVPHLYPPLHHFTRESWLRS